MDSLVSYLLNSNWEREFATQLRKVDVVGDVSCIYVQANIIVVAVASY